LNDTCMTDIFKTIEESRQEMVDLLRELVAIPAIAPESGGEGEFEKVECIEKRLGEFGFSRIEHHDVEDDRVPSGSRPNLILWLDGGCTTHRIVIVVHTDVVPPGNLAEWNTNPFEVVEKDGSLYGRGVEDNGQSIVSSIFAIRALIKNGITPSSDIGIVFAADEETDNVKGIKYLIDQGIFQKDDLILVPDHGNSEGNLIEICEKSIAWIKVKTLGKQCHASLPGKGNNAFRAAIRFGYLVDKELHRRFNKTDGMFDHPRSTFEPTKKEENVPNVNTVPGEDVFYFDCRLLPQYKIDEVLSVMRNIADTVEIETGTQIELECILREDAAPPTYSKAPIVNALKKSINMVYRNKPYIGGIGGVTCAGVLRHAGYQAVVWETVNGTAHLPNEYISINNMVNDCKVFTSLFLNAFDTTDNGE